MSRLRSTARARRAGSALLATGLAMTGSALALGPTTGNASSHREAPLTAANPLVDNTDTYAFVSPDSPDTVTLIANWLPFQDPSGGPNFYPWGADGYRYDIKVDNNGDAKPDFTYRWTFTNDDKRAGSTFLYANGPVNSFDDPTLLFKQTYKLESIDKDGKSTTLVDGGKVAPSNVGEATMPNYAALRDEAITSTEGGGKSYVGQADDPFFLDLRVFDLLYGADLSEAGNDTLTGYNVNTIALQLPTSEVTKGGDGSGIIGVWSTTEQQTLKLSAGKAAPSNIGEATFPNYAALRDEAIEPLKGVTGSSFAGQADDPFFLDLRVFDLLYGGDLSEVGSDTLNGYNVNTIALQVPISEITGGGDNSGIIGIWSTTDQQTLTLTPGKAEPTGDFVQVSRLGMPLVNEVVVPAGLKDAFNSLPPEMDATVQAVVDKVNDPEVPKLIEAIYKLPAPAAPRDDIFSVFLTGVEGLNKPPKVTPAEMIRLNTKIKPAANPSRLGVLAKDTAGFPNGRRLADDVVDIELQALVGAVRTGKIVDALAAGDGVNTNDAEFGSTFPYVALPFSGSSTSARGTSVGGSSGGASTGAGSSSGSAPSGGVATGFGGLADDGLPVLPISIALVGLALAGAGVVLRTRKA